MRDVKIEAKGFDEKVDYVSLNRRSDDETRYVYNTEGFHDGKKYVVSRVKRGGSKIYAGKGLTSKWNGIGETTYENIKKAIDTLVEDAAKDESGANHHHEKYHKILPWHSVQKYNFTFKKRAQDCENEIKAKMEEIAEGLKEKHSGLEIQIGYISSKQQRKMDDISENHFDEKKYVSTLSVKTKFSKTVGKGENQHTLTTTGYDAISDTCGAELFFDYIERVATRATDRAIENSKARAMPKSTDRILMGGQLTGVFIHEMVGHGAEADIAMGGGPMLALYKKKVAIDDVTITDVPISKYGRGNMHFDDEGTPCREVKILEKGVVSDFMTDRANAARMIKAGYDVSPSGNGRSEGYGQNIIPRMRNTIMRSGNKSHDDLLNELGTGLYVIGTSGGHVYRTGEFTLNTSLAYWVENGEIKFPVKTSSLKGNTYDTLGHILSVGNDDTVESFAGTCGKNFQYVPVSAMGPQVLVESMNVTKYTPPKMYLNSATDKDVQLIDGKPVEYGTIKGDNTLLKFNM